MRTPLAVLILALTGAACTAPDGVLDVTFDVCAPVALRAPAATEAQRAAIEQAAVMWREQGFPGVTVDGDDRTPTVSIEFEPAGPASFGYYEDERGVIYINSDLIGRASAITIAHELGHAFGLWHVEPTDRESVMNPGNLVTAPNGADQLALEDLWGHCAARGSVDPRSAR